jgi:hypothetical protein
MLSELELSERFLSLFVQRTAIECRYVQNQLLMAIKYNNVVYTPSLCYSHISGTTIEEYNKSADDELNTFIDQINSWRKPEHVALVFHLRIDSKDCDKPYVSDVRMFYMFTVKPSLDNIDGIDNSM